MKLILSLEEVHGIITKLRKTEKCMFANMRFETEDGTRYLENMQIEFEEYEDYVKRIQNEGVK